MSVVIVTTKDELREIVFSVVSEMFQQQSQANKVADSAQGESKLLTMKALCAELSLSRARINQLIKAGTLKPKRLPGSRRIFFTRDSILKVMERVSK